MRTHIVFASLAAMLVLPLMADGAEAQDHWRWRMPRVFVPDSLWYEEDPSAYDQGYYDDTQDPYVVRRRAKRDRTFNRERDLARELWWMDDTPKNRRRALMEQDIEPRVAPQRKAVKPKTATKKAAVAPKPTLKKPAAIASLPDNKSSLPAIGVTPKVASTTLKPAAPKKLQTASLTPDEETTASTAVKGKSIGCTAGAAVVTGFGFGQVKPKTCTGETYSYDAQRGGKAYVIKLSAASGEITDVKKLP